MVSKIAIVVAAADAACHTHGSPIAFVSLSLSLCVLQGGDEDYVEKTAKNILDATILDKETGLPWAYTVTNHGDDEGEETAWAVRAPPPLAPLCCAAPCSAGMKHSLLPSVLCVCVDVCLAWCCWLLGLM